MIKVGYNYKAFQPEHRTSASGKPYFCCNIQDSSKNPVTGQWEHGKSFRVMCFSNAEFGDSIKIMKVNSVDWKENQAKNGKTYQNITLFCDLEEPGENAGTHLENAEDKMYSQPMNSRTKSDDAPIDDSGDLPF